MTDVADDRLVLHLRHVLSGDDVVAAGSGDEDVGGVDNLIESSNLITVHRGLQRANGIDLGHDHAGTLAAQ